jgi:hypothetical protein
METNNYITSRKYAAGLITLTILFGCASAVNAGDRSRVGDRTSGQEQCPFVAGQYYNFPETASSSLFSDADHDRISCDDNEFCTLSRIFDEETGYHAVVTLEQPGPDTIVFRRGAVEVVKTMASGDFVCNGGSISLSESEPGEQDSVRHLTHLTLDADGSLIARVGLFTSGPGMEVNGPAPLVFSGSAWLRFEAIDERNRKDWLDPVSIRDYLGSTYADLSIPTRDDAWNEICESVNRDRFNSSSPRMEYAWWYQESVWEFRHTWSESLLQALHRGGIRPDNKVAYMWLELAGKEYERLLGGGSFSLDTSAAKRLLTESMTPAEVATAQEMARNWTPANCSFEDGLKENPANHLMADGNTPTKLGLAG